MKWLHTEYDFAAGAIVNFHKPVGKSSFWYVRKIHYLIQTKVGHAGTLDPFAEGVLLLCTGKATKQVSELMSLPKEYIGILRLGIQTETDDATGAIVRNAAVPQLSGNDIVQSLEKFVGDVLQIPPMFSAKKVAGERLYHLARKGRIIDRVPKQVHIESIDLISFHENLITICVKCSKGTYIRALARDIGNDLGCGAHLQSLVRTRIGDYCIEDSIDLERFKQLLENHQE
ncbi:MAG: tRNA pseudouridine(55) synthase TruB [Candidatus Zhuqueibacterota bacterium]